MDFTEIKIHFFNCLILSWPVSSLSSPKPCQFSPETVTTSDYSFLHNPEHHARCLFTVRHGKRPEVLKLAYWCEGTILYIICKRVNGLLHRRLSLARVVILSFCLSTDNVVKCRCVKTEPTSNCYFWCSSLQILTILQCILRITDQVLRIGYTFWPVVMFLQAQFLTVMVSANTRNEFLTVCITQFNT